MKKKRWLFEAVILFVMLLFIITAKNASIGRTSAMDLQGIQNTANVGRITGNTTVSQTFTAGKDFCGVSLLMGTFDGKQHGIVTAEIVNKETGETVLKKNYSTTEFVDNQYFYFASEKLIEVSEPTEFEIILTGKFVLPRQGVTVWCSSGKEYSGEMQVNGVSQDATLCFGLVQDYKETFQWGIFSKRCMIIVLIAAFLSLHCFVDIKTLYSFLFEKRVWIAIALFVFCVANKFNGSSINQYDSHIQQGEGSEYVQTVFGTSRSIRSDEWLVSVPRSLSAEYTGYGKMNDIVRATETTNLSASGLYLNYSALAKPADWGYYLFGSEYGLSFVWSFRMIFGFLFSFELCLILSGRKKLISLLGGAMIWFSSYNMWWSTVTWLIAGQAAIVFFYYFIREKNRGKRLFFGIGIALSAANFVVDLYPAWQVPAGYVFLALLIWIFMDNFSYIKEYRGKDWLLAGGCIAFMISVIVSYLYNYMDYMTAIMNTVYPGGRTYYGGFYMHKLFGYVAASLAPFVQYDNPSELGCFFGLFPFSAVLFVYAMVKQRGKNLLMWLMAVPAVIMSLYCLFPLPHLLAKATLLTFSMPKRVVDVLGYLNVLMLVVALSWFKEQKKFSIKTGVLLAGLSTGSVALYALKYCQNKTTMVFVLLVAVLTFCAEVWMVSDVKEIKSTGSKAAVTVFLIVSGLCVNPLMCGLDAIYSKPVAKEVSQIVSENPDAKWIALDSIITPDYLIACGARTYNSTNYVPNMDFWKKLDPSGAQDEVYNRYAHICIELTEKQTSMELVAKDYIRLSLSYDDLSKLDIDYILGVTEMENAEENGLNEIYSEKGMYIYKVSENIY